MAVTAHAIRIRESTDVAEARRWAGRLAEEMGFAAPDVGRISLVVTEAARNILRHAQAEGSVVLSPMHHDGPSTVLDMLILDRGEGMDDVPTSMRDGHSTAGGAGTGLGAMARTADTLELHSTPGGGTAVLTRFRRDRSAASRQPRFAVGAVNLPYPGQMQCGDAYAIRCEGESVLVLVADGLGHGPEAAAAARAAVESFQSASGASPADIVATLHVALRKTRGAAAAVARIDAEAGDVTFAGVGNITGAIVSTAGRRNMVSHSGIIGVSVRKIQEFVYEWQAAPCLLIIHSDGLSARWDLQTYPGALARDPALVAGLLYRDHARASDDVTVVVVGEPGDDRAG